MGTMKTIFTGLICLAALSEATNDDRKGSLFRNDDNLKQLYESVLQKHSEEKTHNDDLPKDIFNLFEKYPLSHSDDEELEKIVSEVKAGMQEMMSSLTLNNKDMNSFMNLDTEEMQY